MLALKRDLNNAHHVWWFLPQLVVAGQQNGQYCTRLKKKKKALAKDLVASFIFAT